jgi:hypothetical protein
VALRDGPFDLAVFDDQPYLIANGDPIALDARGLQIEPGMAEGIQPRVARGGHPSHAIALGIVDGETWVTTRQEQVRIAYEYDVHVRRSGRWQLRDLEQGPMIEWYTDYVVREGALLGLRAYSSNPRLDTFVGFEGGPDTSPEAEAFRRKLAAALRIAPRGFAWLGGARPQTMPDLAAELDPHAAVSTRDGTLYAMTLTRESAAETASDARDVPLDALLLVWPPGQREATLLEMPTSEWRPSLWVSGDVVLASGNHSSTWLALVRGTQVEVLAAPRGRVESAAISPKGELWAVVGEALWVRAPGDDDRWVQVVLPVRGAIEDPSPWRWSPFRRGWFRAECEADSEPEVDVEAVVHAQGATWVLGEVYGVGCHSTALFASAPTTAPLTILEPYDITLARQHAVLERARKPGDGDCRYVSLVLGDPAEADAFAAKLRKLDLAAIEKGIAVLELYVGELDGKRELVLGLGGEGRSQTKAGLDELTRMLGLSHPRVDCRPRLPIEMIAEAPLGLIREDEGEEGDFVDE